ncbi:MAG TPA: branched-chain amino acid ABC transporter permease, partial [Fimbriimonas sp.]
MKFLAVRLGSILTALGACFLLQAVAQGTGNDYLQRMVVLAGLYVTLAVSLNLINGITGQFSIGHAAFYQVGAYTAGYLTLLNFSKGGPTNPLWLFLMIVVGALAAAVAGFVVGLPSLRLRGDYLAIVTLGFGEIIRITANNLDFTGGPNGIFGIPDFGNFGLRTDIATYWVTAGVVSLAVLASARLGRGRLGRAWRFVR